MRAPSLATLSETQKLLLKMVESFLKFESRVVQPTTGVPYTTKHARSEGSVWHTTMYRLEESKGSKLMELESRVSFKAQLEDN